MLAATLIFALSPRITRWTRQWAGHGRERWPGRLPVLTLYFGIAVYGGFFGAGLGILTLAVLGLLGLEHIHEMNALKVLQASLVNSVAVLTFALAGAVHWPIALLMAAGGIVGGYGFVIQSVRPITGAHALAGVPPGEGKHARAGVRSIPPNVHTSRTHATSLP